MVGGDLRLEHPVDLVIFDCDGVLIDSEVISTLATVQALAALGYRISEAEALRRFVGRSYRSIRADVEVDWGRSLPSSFDADLERMTLSIMEEQLQPVSGVAAMLERLSLKRCVASSSSLAWIRQGLTSTGLIHHLEPHLFSASMVENGKPAPDIFLYAAKEMGALPDHTVVIEDSIAGVKAGAAAGMSVVGFTGGSHVVDPAHGQGLRRAGAGYIIDGMGSLPGLLGNV